MNIKNWPRADGPPQAQKAWKNSETNQVVHREPYREYNYQVVLTTGGEQDGVLFRGTNQKKVDSKIVDFLRDKPGGFTVLGGQQTLMENPRSMTEWGHTYSGAVSEHEDGSLTITFSNSSRIEYSDDIIQIKGGGGYYESDAKIPVTVHNPSLSFLAAGRIEILGEDKKLSIRPC